MALWPSPGNMAHFYLRCDLANVWLEEANCGLTEPMHGPLSVRAAYVVRRHVVMYITVVRGKGPGEGPMDGLFEGRLVDT
jgi:hypothetical protein